MFDTSGEVLQILWKSFRAFWAFSVSVKFLPLVAEIGNPPQKSHWKLKLNLPWKYVANTNISSVQSPLVFLGPGKLRLKGEHTHTHKCFFLWEGGFPYFRLKAIDTFHDIRVFACLVFCLTVRAFLTFWYPSGSLSGPEHSKTSQCQNKRKIIVAADFKHIEEFFAGNFHKSLGNNFRSSFFGRPSNLALVQPNRDFSGYREGIKREASCFFFPKKTFSNEQVFRGGRDAKCEGVTTKNYKKCRQSVAGVSILRY